jgi:hypothetical protein
VNEATSNPVVISAAELDAAMTRGRIIGSSLSNRLMAGQAGQRELFELVQQRFQTPLGQVEAAGLLDVVAGTMLAHKALLRSTAEQAAATAKNATAEACGEAFSDALEAHCTAIHKAYRDHMERVDAALRRVYAELIKVVPEAERIKLPALPAPPAKPKRIAFEFNTAGDIVGATLH